MKAHRVFDHKKIMKMEMLWTQLQNYGEFLQVVQQERDFEILQTADLCLSGRKQMHHNPNSQLLEIQCFYW